MWVAFEGARGTGQQNVQQVLAGHERVVVIEPAPLGCSGVLVREL